MTRRGAPPGKVRPPTVGAGGRDADERLADGGTSTLSLDDLNRCGRELLDGGPCRTPVARPGLSCYWHATPGGGRRG